jgi:hypothetical protein
VPASELESQLAALLQLRDALDPGGRALGGWTRAAGAGGGFCKFPGVACDAALAVFKVQLVAPPGLGGGRLPPAAALKGLPHLNELTLAACGLRGTIPSDYAQLRIPRVYLE